MYKRLANLGRTMFFQSSGLAILIPSYLGLIGLTALTLLLGLTTLGTVFAILALIATGFLGLCWHLFQKRAVSHTRAAIVRGINNQGIKNFELDQCIPPDRWPSRAVRKACRALYKKGATRLLEDLDEDSKDRHYLDSLQQKLRIPTDVARDIETSIKTESYTAELSEKLSDGRISEKEKAELMALRKDLNLSDDAALTATKGQVTQSYKELFKQFVEDGRLSRSEREELHRYQEATGLSATEASQLTTKESIGLYRRTATMICEDGIITDEELEELNELQDFLDVPPGVVADCEKQMERTRELQRIREGNLPSIPIQDLMLNGSEICHWRSQCTYTYNTANGNSRSVSGELVVTSSNIILTDTDKPLQFKLDHIMNIEMASNRLVLSLTRKKGQGAYRVPNPDKLEAILHALCRGANRVTPDETDSSRSRHIPDDIKTRVWRRDGGKCVKCGATDYLEYDHIIPFSKGGANTANNIQLLCRKCNMSKGNEIGGGR